MRPFLLLLLLLHFSGHSQVDANNWYFGNNAGINFGDGTPTALFNGQLNTIEGCTSLSDASGNLLFYTNGLTIWNKQHLVMQNGTGLFGDLSSSQSAIILKRPGSTDSYFIFTSNPFNGSGGFRFSEVDLSLNGGNGAVVQKNVLLYEPTCEKMAAVRHANGQDIWIVSHAYGSDAFYAHLLTAEGVVGPIISHSGISVVTEGDVANAIGYMKISPDGKKLIACHTYLKKAELFDFDPQTGAVSNSNLISDEGMHVYGAEFSSDSNLLYIASVDEKRIWQYNLSAGDIEQSKILLATVANFPGAMQLAPDGKIYVALAENDKLGRIGNPEIPGAGCNFVENAVDLGGRLSMLGLPSFEASMFNNRIRVENICSASPSIFTVTTGQQIDNVVWDFGDTATSTELSPSHTYALPGEYVVTVTATNASCSITKKAKITIHATPVAPSLSVQNVCMPSSETYDISQMDTLLLNGQSPDNIDITYYQTLEDAENLSNSLASDFLLPIGQSTLFACMKNEVSGCFVITNFDLMRSDQPIATTPGDFIICEQSPYDGTESFDLELKNAEILAGQDPNIYTVSYHYSLADAAQGINPISLPYTNTATEELLYLRVSNPFCYATAELRIKVIPAPKTTTVTAFTLCDDQEWDGHTEFLLTEKTAEVMNGMDPAEFLLSYHSQLAHAESNSNPIFGAYTNISSPQTVYARIESIHGGCEVIVPIELIVKDCPKPVDTSYSFPKFFTPNGDGANDNWQVVFRDQNLRLSISIFDRNGKFIKNMSCTEGGWDGMLNGQPLPSNDYWFVVTGNDKPEYQGHFSLIR